MLSLNVGKILDHLVQGRPNPAMKEEFENIENVSTRINFTNIRLQAAFDDFFKEMDGPTIQATEKLLYDSDNLKKVRTRFFPDIRRRVGVVHRPLLSLGQGVSRRARFGCLQWKNRTGAHFTYFPQTKSSERANLWENVL